MDRLESEIYPVIWLTGQTGAGKTTIARALYRRIGGVVLDGDEMRWSISEKAGFNKQDRREHNLRVARLAKILSQYCPVIVAVIAPFEEVRREIEAMVNPVWIYVERDLPIIAQKPYELPVRFHLKINLDKQKVHEQVLRIERLLRSYAT